MKTMKCSNMYIEAMCSMPSSSKEQNQSLRRKIEEGLNLDHCFIKVDKEQVVCRAILFQDVNYIAYITVEDIRQEEIQDFIYDVCQSLDTSMEWKSDLYSDKVYFEHIRKALQAHFDTEIRRESYTCKTSKQDISNHTFKSEVLCPKEEVIQLMMRATSTTLDTTLQHDQQQSGLRAYIEDMYADIRKHSNEELFQILFVEENAVGFIAVKRFLKDVGGIGYIGVDPAFQGNHYGDILVKKALDMAFTQGIHKLIGDIDTQNYAIRHHLQSGGFRKDCDQHLFTRNKR